MLNNAVRPDDFVNLWPESPISYEALYGPGLTRPAARALMPNTERSVAAARSTCQAWNAHANARLTLCQTFDAALAGPPERTWCAHGTSAVLDPGIDVVLTVPAFDFPCRTLPDRFRSESTVFTEAYVSSPICVSSKVPLRTMPHNDTPDCAARTL